MELKKTSPWETSLGDVFWPLGPGKETSTLLLQCLCPQPPTPVQQTGSTTSAVLTEKATSVWEAMESRHPAGSREWASSCSGQCCTGKAGGGRRWMAVVGMGGISAGTTHRFYSTFFSTPLPHLRAMASRHHHVQQKHVHHAAQPLPAQHLAGSRCWHTCRTDPLHNSALVLGTLGHTRQSKVPEDPTTPWAVAAQAVPMPPCCSGVPTSLQEWRSFPQAQDL